VRWIPYPFIQADAPCPRDRRSERSGFGEANRTDAQGDRKEWLRCLSCQRARQSSLQVGRRLQTTPMAHQRHADEAQQIG